jgi:hypothetical protein
MNKKPENTIIGGFVRGRSAKHIIKESVSIEAPVADELTVPNPEEMEANLKPPGKVWAGKRTRRTKLAVMGLSSAAIDTGHPAYARCVRLAATYRKKRTQELAVSHGYVSSGASALLATSAMALAASRFLYEKAAEGGPGMLATLKAAANLGDSARQNELAAWELAAREATSRKKMSALSNGTPWVISDDTSGYEKKKPGPKKNRTNEDVYNVPALPPVGAPLEGWIQSASLPEEDKGNG